MVTMILVDSGWTRDCDNYQLIQVRYTAQDHSMLSWIFTKHGLC